MGHIKGDQGPTVGVDADHPLQVTSSRLSAAAIVTAVGEVDLATAGELAAAVRAALDSRPGTVVIDLTEVQFLDSSGLAVLAEAELTATETGQLLRVVVGDRHPVVFRALTTSGIALRLALFGDLDEALRAG
jgi:anti-sigma B factor antagonist